MVWLVAEVGLRGAGAGDRAGDRAGEDLGASVSAGWHDRNLFGQAEQLNITAAIQLGGDATAMAGPVGRSGEAQTDALMRAEILSYSRAHGIFAGVSSGLNVLGAIQLAQELGKGHTVVTVAVVPSPTASSSGWREPNLT